MTPGQHAHAPFLRVAGFLVLVLLLRAAGNTLLAFGMRQVPQSVADHLGAFLQAISNPYVDCGILALLLTFLVRMALLSLADLSYVLPVTAIGYFLAALMGKTFLHETVTPQRWLGTVLIMVGAALVGSTEHSTTEHGPL
jgi:uncharacterized membrane protein